MLRSDTLQITPEILSLIARIDEFKGAWRALGTLAPDRLSALRRVATIESIGSSTRIEGSKLSDREVENLLSNLAIQSFETRDEQEVAGYAELMDLVFSYWRDIPFNENHIKQLHQILLRLLDVVFLSTKTTSSNCIRSCCATVQRTRGTVDSTRPTQTAWPLSMRTVCRSGSCSRRQARSTRRA